MSETIQSAAPLASQSIDHLSVRSDGLVPMGPTFMVGRTSGRLPLAFAASFAFDAAFVLLLVVLTRMGVNLATSPAVLPEDPNKDIVWLSQPGPGGGGGGGGNKMKEPPRVAELKGKDKITVPVEKPPALELPKATPPPEAPVMQQVNIPAKMLAAADDVLTGAIESAPAGPPTLSQGSGSGGGAGTGTGSGVGSGTGSGLGPGYGGGTGGGVYQPGNGVGLPRLIRDVKPKYTSDAMRAKIQGTVLMQCVVRPDGSVTDVSVVRSLDPVFGLDQEAIIAARQWKFQPGTRMGQPVAVQITIEMQFSLR